MKSKMQSSRTANGEHKVMIGTSLKPPKAAADLENPLISISDSLIDNAVANSNVSGQLVSETKDAMNAYILNPTADNFLRALETIRTNINNDSPALKIQEIIDLALNKNSKPLPPIDGKESNTNCDVKFTRSNKKSAINYLSNDENNDNTKIKENESNNDNCDPKLNKKYKKCRNWKPWEDTRLIAGIYRYGLGDWKNISQFVGANFTRSQCSQRWCRALNPKIEKEVWTMEEQQTLLCLVERYGEHNWSVISKHLGKRTDVQCRYRYMQIQKMMNSHANHLTGHQHKNNLSAQFAFKKLTDKLFSPNNNNVTLNYPQNEVNLQHIQQMQQMQHLQQQLQQQSQQAQQPPHVLLPNDVKPSVVDINNSLFLPPLITEEDESKYYEDCNAAYYSSNGTTEEENEESDFNHINNNGGSNNSVLMDYEQQQQQQQQHQQQQQEAAKQCVVEKKVELIAFPFNNPFDCPTEQLMAPLLMKPVVL